MLHIRERVRAAKDTQIEQLSDTVCAQAVERRVLQADLAIAGADLDVRA